MRLQHSQPKYHLSSSFPPGQALRVSLALICYGFDMRAHKFPQMPTYLPACLPAQPCLYTQVPSSAPINFKIGKIQLTHMYLVYYDANLFIYIPIKSIHLSIHL